MDCKMIKKGTKVYLPVFVEGALLQMGDIHASMGDGELCGTGIEIEGRITAKTSLIKEKELNWPVAETATHWYVNVNGGDYDSALKAASLEMQRLLMAATGWDETDAFIFLSIKGDVGINQACSPCPIDMSLRMGLEKNNQFKPLIR